jgi:Fe-S oxidoreductase
MIREGKLKVNSDWNRDLKVKFTVQDPCQLVRKSLGDPVAEDLRFVVKTVVGEENFVDMTPNRSNNYCCGGGGGFLQSGLPEARRAYGKLKFDQIMATGATYAITPCEGHYHTVHLWSLICLAMGALGPNERTYLGEDLAELLMPEVRELEEEE